MARAKRYTVSDGKLVLVLQEEEKGWFTVTSPLDPAVTVTLCPVAVAGKPLGIVQNAAAPP